VAAAVQAHPLLLRAIPHLDVPVSLVGGAVRDALLGVADTEDLDLVVEGDALALAERLGHELNVRAITHERFGTAYLELPHDNWIDIVRARRERYPHPGSLPVVEPGTLLDDLARRDFTINAIAYRLNGHDRGTLVDPHDGRRDLADGIVRVLRVEAFVEDPTRVLRAVRYAARLGFTLDQATLDGARAASPAIDLRSARVGEELRRLLKEAEAGAAIAMAADLGVPWVAGDMDDCEERFAAVDVALGLPGAPALEPWAVRMGLAVAPEHLPHVAVDGWARGVAAAAAQGAELRRRLDTVTTASGLDEVLNRAKPASVVVAHALGEPRIADWWATVRGMRLAISGEDLVAAGIRPGPAIGRALAAVRAARLDGHVGTDPAAQLELALRAAVGP
jgi:tRNA nucleotidyltransferase (CCA-adding enzyme)